MDCFSFVHSGVPLCVSSRSGGFLFESKGIRKGQGRDACVFRNLCGSVFKMPLVGCCSVFCIVDFCFDFLLKGADESEIEKKKMDVQAIVVSL